ncbi:VOC family protein [Nocardia sp. NPDC004278]
MGSTLNPCIVFDGNAREALQFYQSVLGGELHIGTVADFGSPDAPDADNVMHAVLSSPTGYTIMGWDAPERVEYRPGTNVAIFIGGDDSQIRDYYEKLSADGTVTLPLEKQSWGDEAGSLIDKFGISWMFNITRP